MSTILNLSEETYQQLADLVQQQHRTLVDSYDVADQSDLGRHVLSANRAS
jgi:hypothetical protein